MTRIIFQDIDGPLIPLRMYYGGRRPFDGKVGSFIYDPIAVGMLKHLCDRFDAKVVFNTAHNENPNEIMQYQGECNGMKEILHPVCSTDYIRRVDGRLEAIHDWLSRHPDVLEWVVIDDMIVHEPRQAIVNYEVGMTLNTVDRVYELFGEPVRKIIGVGQVHGRSAI